MRLADPVSVCSELMASLMPLTVLTALFNLQEEFLHTFWDKGGQMHNSWDREHEFRVPADVCSPSGARESAPQTTPLQSVPEDLR